MGPRTPQRGLKAVASAATLGGQSAIRGRLVRGSRRRLKELVREMFDDSTISAINFELDVAKSRTPRAGIGPSSP